MIIAKATTDQLPIIMEFYYAVIDDIGDSKDSVGWQKDIYPSSEFLRDAIQNGELFVGLEDGDIIGSMAMNHQFNEEYNKCPWPTQADEAKVTIIHALAVHPMQKQKGYAKQLVQFAIDYARESQQKAIRIDVLPRNRNAKKLYLSMGFQHVQTMRSFYEDIGWEDFELYEYSL